MPCVLGHALDLRARHGGNAQHDRMDAPTGAALLRGGLLPQADVYPRRRRATRALLRRRHHLLPERAEVSAPIQQTSRPAHRGAPWGRLAAPQHRRGLLERCDPRGVPQHLAVDLALGAGDEPWRAALARSSATTAQGPEPVALALLRTGPGVGNILALGRRSEREERARCPRGHACGSSGRLVTKASASTGTRHRPSGQTSGTAHRHWALPAAAGPWRKHNAPAHQSRATLATTHGPGKALAILAHHLGRAVYCRRPQHVAFAPAKCLATEGWRARTHGASTWSHRGQRHPPCAPHRALRLRGQAPAPAVPVPHGTPGSLWRCWAVRSAPRACRHAPTRLAAGAAPSPSPARTGWQACRPRPLR